MNSELRTAARVRPYLWGALVCSLLALVGFARTYYLKGLFGTPQLPPQLHVHGLIMSAWCALFVAQACLVSARRVDIHRRLGIVGAGLALVVVVIGSYLTISATAREVHSHVVRQFHVLFGFNLLNLAVFVGLLSTALAFRRKPEFHKRFMLLAFISLLPPAIARATLLFTPDQAAQMWAVNVVVVIFVAVDVIRHRRLHPAFGWGALALLVPLNAGYMLFQTDPWTRFVTGLFS
jgi:FtsH-binding integral membrane protein